jgi:cytochrome b
MANDTTVDNGHSGARTLAVWDPLVRITHWSVAVIVLINSFSDGEGDLHEWAGYIALGCVLLRLLWGVLGSTTARFSAFPPNPIAAIQHLLGGATDKHRIHLSHNPAGALMVYNLWLTLLFISATGYMMGTMQFFGVAWVEEAHILAYNWLILSVILHVGGVALDTWRTGVALVPAMVTGRKRIPEEAKTE